MAINDSCKIPGDACSPGAKIVRGMCRTHYYRWKTHGDPHAGRKRPADAATEPPETCPVEGCNQGVEANGLCSTHDQRQRKGLPLDDPIRAANGSVPAWVDDLLTMAPTGKCVTWPFSRDHHGYPWWNKPGAPTKRANRLICELANGGDAGGPLYALHSCGKGHEGCVAPWHLYWGDQFDNMADRDLHGTSNAGSAHGLSKLVESDVVKILDDLAARKWTQKEIGDRYGVSSATVGDIKRGKLWKHVPRVRSERQPEW